MGKKLYVGNMGYDVENSTLEQLFAPHGTVQSAQVIADRDTGRSKGFGFVEMGSDAEAQADLLAIEHRASTAPRSARSRCLVCGRSPQRALTKHPERHRDIRGRCVDDNTVALDSSRLGCRLSDWLS